MEYSDFKIGYNAINNISDILIKRAPDMIRPEFLDVFLRSMLDVKEILNVMDGLYFRKD